jgi:hypothetical protein
MSTLASSDSMLDMPSSLSVKDTKKTGERIIKEGKKSKGETNSKTRKEDKTKKNEKRKKKEESKSVFPEWKSGFGKSFDNLEVDPFDEDCFDVQLLCDNFSESGVTSSRGSKKVVRLSLSMPDVGLDRLSEEARQIPPSTSSRSMDLPRHASEQRSLQQPFANSWTGPVDWTKLELERKKSDDEDSQEELEAAIDKLIDVSRQRTKARVVEPIFWSMNM